MQLIQRWRAAHRRRSDDERGFTLIEMMIATSLLTLVIAVICSSLWTVQRNEQFSRGRTEALDSMRGSLDRMTKDLRQAYSINGTPDATTLDVNTYLNGVPTRIYYDMTGSTLIRRVNGGPAIPVQKGLTSSSIFSYTPDATSPDVVSIVFVVKPPNLPDTTLTLNAEVTFRNMSSL
jgi:prepilin-type N-terminal cleavage/methylation domain-containing protein